MKKAAQKAAVLKLMKNDRIEEINIEDEVVQNDADTEETLEMEDIVETDAEGNEKNLAQKNKELRLKIKQLESEKKEYLDGWQRAKADAVNKEKVHQEERQRTISLANKKLLLDMIPVMDSFMMAMGNKETWEKVDSNWRVGIEYIKTQLNTVFENNSLVIYGKVGDDADPNKYNTLETIETDDEQKDHTVVEILQYGYILDGNIIREAKCKTFLLNKSK